MTKEQKNKIKQETAAAVEDLGGDRLAPLVVFHFVEIGAREHRRAYTLKTGETIKTAYTTKAGAFFLVFENEETGARRVWTVYER